MKKFLTVAVCFSAFCSTAEASTLSYKFLIPAFGGDPNYFYVFKTEADVQNIYHAPEKPPTPPPSAIDEFKKRLQYLILSRLSSKIVDAAFGNTESLPQGTYEIGNYQVTVQNTGESIQVNLVDTTTGSSTTVEVPFYK